MRIAVVSGDITTLKEIVKSIDENINCKYTIFSKMCSVIEKIENDDFFDVYIIDLENLGIEGVSLAKTLRKQMEAIYIIFISSDDELVLDDHDPQIKAFQYVLKGNIKKRLPNILLEIENNTQYLNTEYLVICNREKTACIKLQEIMYISKEKNGKNVVFVTNKDEYKKRGTLDNVLKMIHRPEFIMADKGYIINMSQVQKISDNIVYFYNQSKIYISYSAKNKVKSQIIHYWENQGHKMLR